MLLLLLLLSLCFKTSAHSLIDGWTLDLCMDYLRSHKSQEWQHSFLLLPMFMCTCYHLEIRMKSGFVGLPGLSEFEVRTYLKILLQNLEFLNSYFKWNAAFFFQRFLLFQHLHLYNI